MKKLILVMLLMTVSTGVAAEALTDEKKALIDELLEITGAIKIGEMMGNAVAQNMISQIAQRQDNKIDPRLVEIIREEIGAIMHEQFMENRFVNEMSYDIYHKYLTLDEISQLVAFYKTPVGLKVVSVLPNITQEGMAAGQKHGETLGPMIRDRLTKRFEAEGFN